MLFGSYVATLMAAYPTRKWRMAALVRSAASQSTRSTATVRRAVHRVVAELIKEKLVECTPPSKPGSYALYQWRGDSARAPDQPPL